MAEPEISRFVDLSEREAKHLICSICLNIFNNAVNSECGHTFCKDCLQEWIEDNHNRCPECRKEFKRVDYQELNNSGIVLGDFQFIRSLKINTIISELKIKCNFDFNGCQKLVEFGHHSTHHKGCEHRMCKICETDLGLIDEHKCIDILRIRANEEYVLKLNQIQKKLDLVTIENKELRSRIRILEQSNQAESSSQNMPDTLRGLKLNTFKVFLGTLSKSGYFIDFDEQNNMVFKSKSIQNNCPRFHIDLGHIQSLMYCVNSSVPILVISFEEFICNVIRRKIWGIYPGDDYLPDPTKAYLFIELLKQKEDISVLKSFVHYFERSHQGRKVVALTPVAARDMLREVRNN